MPAIQPTWTTERVQLLKTHFEAGLTCREIANQIGVSRNAVIGKITRLNLTREKCGAVRKAAERQPEPLRRPGSRLRRQFLRAVPIEEAEAAQAPIHNGHCCSLFELSEQTCRWPISSPGLPDFCFCGNPPIEGLPYCTGHSRLAYRLSAR